MADESRTSELLVGVAIQLVRLRNGCLMLPDIKCSSAACFPSLTVFTDRPASHVSSSCRSEMGQAL